MDRDRITEVLQRVPWPLVFLGIWGWLAYDVYLFKTDASSPLFEKTNEIQTVTAENGKLQVRVRELKNFLRSLEQKRAELRGLASKLEESKASLSETFDVPSFMQMAVTEAKRLGLTVVALRPTEKANREFYAEQSFEFGFKGVYVQVLVFLHRMAQIQTIVRVENFMIRPAGPRNARYVALEGTMQIKGYYYLRSRADDLAKTGGGS